MIYRSLAKTALAVLVLMICAVPVTAENIEDIRILTATEREDGVISDNFFEIEVSGSDITSVGVRDLTSNAWYDLSYNPSRGAWLYRDDGYATVTDLYAVHSNPTNYMFYFNGDESTYEDVVLLGYARAHPTDFLDITFPANQEDSVSVDAIMMWDFDGWAEIIGAKIVSIADNQVVDEIYSTDLSLDQWDPDLLEPVAYQLQTGAWSVVAGDPYVSGTLFGDQFNYTALVVDSNTIYFTTGPTSAPPPEVPEPATMTLLGSGAAFMGYLARRKRKRQAMR
jgi:hypothetical protein